MLLVELGKPLKCVSFGYRTTELFIAYSKMQNFNIDLRKNYNSSNSRK